LISPIISMSLAFDNIYFREIYLFIKEKKIMIS
jgi:hypothetical protein